MRDTRRTFVLLVEDNSIDSMLVERTFCKANQGVECRRVSSAEEAIGYLEGRGSYADRERFPLPDTVVTDLRLPGLSGLDLLSWIQKQPALKDLPVIVITGHGNRQIDRAYDLGAYFYLVKPLSVDIVAEVLSSFGAPNGAT